MTAQILLAYEICHFLKLFSHKLRFKKIKTLKISILLLKIVRELLGVVNLASEYYY